MTEFLVRLAGLTLGGSIGVGSTAEEVRAARPELEEDPDGFLFQTPVEFYRDGPLDAVCRLWTADGVVTELRLDLPSVQTEYEVGVSVGLAGTELMAIPCGLPRMEWGEAPQSDTGDSFSMEVEAAAGTPLPLNAWGSATLLVRNGGPYTFYAVDRAGNESVRTVDLPQGS